MPIQPATPSSSSAGNSPVSSAASASPVLRAGSLGWRWCELVGKETLCDGQDRKEPVRRFTFRAPAGCVMDADAALRQVVLLSVQGERRMYSPVSEPGKEDGTFDLIVRIYRGGLVSGWLDELPLGGQVSAAWPWPTQLPPDRRNVGARVGLVAYGVGITELYRVAINELRDVRVQQVVLLYATRTLEEQAVLGGELGRLLGEAGHRFRLERALTRERPQVSMRSGRVDSRMLAEVFPWRDDEQENVRFLVSGTKVMIQATMALLDAQGYDRGTYKLIQDLRRSPQQEKTDK